MAFPIRATDVMSSPARTIAPETTAAEAAAGCAAAGVGSPVAVEGDDPVGIVTATGFLELLGTETDPGSRTVRAFMSAPVETIDADVPVADAVAAMSEAGVACLAVLEAGELVGVVSSDGVVRHVPQVLHRRRLDTPSAGDHGYRVRQETAYEDPDWTFECACHAEDAVSVGDRVTFTKTVHERDVRTFAAASGDANRLHLDEDYAAGTRFGRRIVHGRSWGA